MNAIWIAVAAVSLLGLAFGAILGYASRRFAVEDDPVVEKIDEILPQSQCGQCGYPGCRPYAEAISCNGEKINRCAPGGEAVMLKITIRVIVWGFCIATRAVRLLLTDQSFP